MVQHDPNTDHSVFDITGTPSKAAISAPHHQALPAVTR